MARIFISYKRVDEEKVFRIKDQIESALGEKCWIDLDGIESDAQFKNIIIKAINECEVVLFMYSKAHSKIVDFEKDWTVRELNFASKKNKRIVFVNLDGSSLSDAFEFDYGTKQQISANDEASIERLIKDLAKWLKIQVHTKTEKNQENIKEDGEEISSVSTISRFFPFYKRKYVCPTFLGITFVCCVCSEFFKNDILHTLCAILTFLSFVLAIGVIFNKKLFGVDSIVRGLGYFVVAFILSAIAFFVSDPNENIFEPIEKEQQSQVCPTCNGTGKDDNGNTCLTCNGEGKASSPQTSAKCIAIDLELPSGTLWADRNIGAKESTDYGVLYSWGELKPKNDYHQSCYTDIHLSSIVGTKYDVCTVELGADWQIPSQKQFDELIAECKWEWGGNGFTITGKNGKTIFLPATGWSCSSNVEYRNQYGYYWTGDKVNDTFAKGLLFSKSEQKTGNGYLYYGRAIRAVKRKSN